MHSNYTNSFYESEQITIIKSFYALALLCVIGALILSYIFLPGEPPRGTQWKAAAYSMSIIYLIAGFIQAALFVAIGLALSYLRMISQNIESLHSIIEYNASKSPLYYDNILCPYCLETVKKEAVKCRYCASDIIKNE